MPAAVERIHAWLEAHENKLISYTQDLLRIPTIEAEPLPGAPFGAANRQALDLVLGWARSSGMRAVDMEGYCGYAEFGSGSAQIASFGHIDVVPVGPGWKHDPFGAEIDGDYLYARGAVDDKGPTVASFFALCAIHECFPDLGVTFRQFFGCNEESGFHCIEHYAAREPAPSFGIAPDSGWPLYYAEKGILNLELTVPLFGQKMQLRSAEGGQRPNIVIDSASAHVGVLPEARATVEQALADAWDRNVTYAWEGNELGLFAIGKASHGSRPFGGDSAAIRLFRFLTEIAPDEDKPVYDALMDLTQLGGAGLGIAGADEPSRDLTNNLGIVKTEAGALQLLFNIRYPVTWTSDDIVRRCRAHLAELPLSATLATSRDAPPLYFPLEHPLVGIIIDAYEAETGERKKPGAMGGGTYARAIANTVSIGTGWEGDGEAHETDERVKVAHLLRMSKIYARILHDLALAAKNP